MCFNDLVAMAKIAENQDQIWLTTETLDKLSKEKFRTNSKDNLVISNDDIDIEVSLSGRLVSNCGVFFAKIERISEVFANTNLRKQEIYVSPKQSDTKARILIL